jgi:DMSO/TMAO reductase YedYZ heme-binding membrane subunit
VVAGAAASGATPRGRDVLLATQHFMLFYSGVLALVALTTAVGVGVVATDRIVMTPGHRVIAQAVHRAVSFGALAFLITHIVLEILAHRSHVIDAVVPFLAQGRRFYIGLGTVASDLVVVLIITGIMRGRFASRRPGTWRAIHAVAYLMWPLSILHGLLAGRKAHPYVDWSYGACVALVALALLIRFVATIRSHQEKAPHGLPDYVSSAVQAPMAALPPQETTGQWSAVQQPSGLGRAVPHARAAQGAMPQAPRTPRALPPGTADRTAVPDPQPQPQMQSLPYPPPQMQSLPYPPPQTQPEPYPQPQIQAQPYPHPQMQPQPYPQPQMQPQPQPYQQPQRPPQRQPRRQPQPHQPPSIATRRLATPRPDLPIPQPHQQEMRPWQQREWQEQQQDVTPWQQEEWEQHEWQQQAAPALEPGQVEYWDYPEDSSEPDYPAYPAYPGAEG